MKINRLELIDTIEKRIKNIIDQHNTRWLAKLAMWEDERREYFSHTDHAWLQFADIVKQKISRCEIIAVDDVPVELRSRHWSSVALFDVKKPCEPMLPAQVAQLRLLIDVLHSTADDEISTYALEKMGFRLGKVLG